MRAAPMGRLVCCYNQLLDWQILVIADYIGIDIILFLLNFRSKHKDLNPILSFKTSQLLQCFRVTIGVLSNEFCDFRKKQELLFD